MKEFIQFANLNVEIWRRPRQKRMYLTVRDDGGVRITCNMSQPRRVILQFITDNREFIARRAAPPIKQFLSGDTLLYLGRDVRLEVTWTWDQRARLIERSENFELLAPLGMHRNDRATAIGVFFRDRGRDHLIRRTEELARQTGLAPASVSIRGQRSRWGSCTARGAISLNWKLMAAPASVIDYVIVHELAHLEQLNHSAEFWCLVERHQPNWRAASAWLKTHGRVIGTQFATVDGLSSR